MNDAEHRVVRAWLTTSRSEDWAILRADLDGYVAMWADAGGLHLSSDLPLEWPQYTTHLWAWSGEDRLVRLRLADGTAYLSALSVTGVPPDERSTEVRVRHELGLRMVSARGSTAALRLADDTPSDLAGSAAEAFTVLSHEASGLAFVRVQLSHTDTKGN